MRNNAKNETNDFVECGRKNCEICKIVEKDSNSAAAAAAAAAAMETFSQQTFSLIAIARTMPI